MEIGPWPCMLWNPLITWSIVKDITYGFKMLIVDHIDIDIEYRSEYEL